jgi:hypothetical protein
MVQREVWRKTASLADDARVKNHGIVLNISRPLFIHAASNRSNPIFGHLSLAEITDSKLKLTLENSVILEFSSVSLSVESVFLEFSSVSLSVVYQTQHITIRGCYIPKTEIKCDCLYKILSTNVSS